MGSGLGAGAMGTCFGLTALTFALTADLCGVFGMALVTGLAGLATLACGVDD